jgi:SAM-dependent methyltransferase
VTSPDLGAVFSAAHVEFAVLSPLLWEPAATATLALSKPRPGERVLDVCCGAGASAIPSAEAVGTGGRVDAIDLAGALLDAGRAEAARRGLHQLRFVQADATTWLPESHGDGSYDLVQCVYGIFFLPDMDAGAAHLVSLLRPGGRLAITTWQSGAISPVPELLVQAVTEVGQGPPEQLTRPPVERINTPDLLASWLTGLGLRDVEVIEVPRQVVMDERNAWALIMGGGLRALVMGMDAGTTERVRIRFIELLAHRELWSLNANSLAGIGTR